MEKVLRCSEVSLIDRMTVRDFRVPEALMIENAAVGFVSTLSVAKGSLVQIICGKGNNGADGFAIGRHLVNSFAADVRCIQIYDALNDECARQRDMAMLYGVQVTDMSHFIPQGGIVIDALYGTGFHAPMDERGLAALKALEGHPNIISVDIPSGISDRTALNAISVKARMTVTFGAFKPCLLAPYASSRVSEAQLPIVKNPLFPRRLLDDGSFDIRLVDDSDISIGRLASSAFKNIRGHVAFFGGKESQKGAAVLAGLAAFRARAGLVTVLHREGEVRSGDARSFDYPQLMSGSWDDDLGGFQAAGMGNGLDTENPDSLKALKRLLAFDIPTVLDSGALRLINRITAIKRSKPLILTPHMGELKALLEIDDIGALSTEQYIDRLIGKAGALGAVIVAKSNVTWIASPEGRISIVWGNLGQLGVAGSGDVLCGIITSLLGQGMEAEAAAVNGVLLHLRAGRIACGLSGWFDSMGLIEAVGKAMEGCG
ncbi:MAG: bifunctional ADP-dependent NAD(P)H-hydrate dehydratase/NAD(P)H-hydrate epimerase [Sphaerochaetaceae bacterium]